MLNQMLGLILLLVGCDWLQGPLRCHGAVLQVLSLPPVLQTAQHPLPLCVVYLFVPVGRKKDDVTESEPHTLCSTRCPRLLDGRKLARPHRCRRIDPATSTYVACRRA